MATVTPVRITSKYQNPRTGRYEVWSAKSVDEVWVYERIEDTGTPWIVTHVPSGAQIWLGSLPKARRFTARPDAADAAQREQARDDEYRRNLAVRGL